jgi:hypothetical protein
MPISRAMQAAGLAQPPALVFIEQSCMAFLLQPPTPLLLLRPAAATTPLAVDCVSSALASLLFPEWEAAGVALEMPPVVSVGQLVPLALVLSKAQGTAIENLTLVTSSRDVSLDSVLRVCVLFQVRAAFTSALGTFRDAQQQPCCWSPMDVFYINSVACKAVRFVSDSSPGFGCIEYTPCAPFLESVV